jgi:GT2 family glycosyltransferase
MRLRLAVSGRSPETSQSLAGRRHALSCADVIAMIAVVVLTYNRLHLLRQCVENVLARTSSETTEIVIWNNASNDGTREYLDSLSDPRIRVVHHSTNVGQNGYALAFEMTTAPFLIELDDDVIDAPPNWDRDLLEAFERLPTIGFLAANLDDDPHDQAAWWMHHEHGHLYTTEVVNGLTLLRGPTGGGCAITSRALHDRVGGFRQNDGAVFWLEDAAYIEDIAKLGYEAAFLRDLRVHHAGGAYYAAETQEKHQFWSAYVKRQKRRNAVKRAVLRVPFVAEANQRRGWFQPPREVVLPPSSDGPGSAPDPSPG